MGAPVLTMDGKLVGMVISQNKNASMALPIQAVLGALGVDLAADDLDP